jgi:hypothetical protein
MIPLTRSAAILDDHTRLARLEIDAAGPLLLATLGTAAVCRHHAFTSPLLRVISPLSNAANELNNSVIFTY